MGSKAEYLQRYLSGPSDGAASDYKHKKRRKQTKEKRIKIIDPDADVACPVAAPKVTKRHIRAAYESEPEEDDEEPVVEIIKGAQVEELALMGRFKTDSWTAVNGGASTSRARRRHDSDSDSGHDSAAGAADEDDSDASPPRRGNIKAEAQDSDASPPRRSRVKAEGSDSDASPPRRQIKKEVDSDASPPRRGQRKNGKRQAVIKQEIDSDASPPRRAVDSDHDQSPPRRTIKQEPGRDLSPVRNREASDDSPPKKRRKDRSTRWASPSPKEPTTSKTLDGKKAGLQSAADLRTEAEELRRREEQMFRQLDASMSGRDAAPVARRAHYDKKTGKLIDPAKQKQEEEEAKKKQQELQEKYAKWNKGLKQIDERKAKLDEMAELAAKPFARHAGDEDVEKHLKEQELADDPMLEYIRKKKEKRKIKSGKHKIYPKYEGPLPAPNRFGVGPGYRWDGVDRSNGFEAKLMSQQNDKRAEQEEFLKWQMGSYE